MADYWKSGERHFCTFCKCWLAGNKISIDLHERGNHHKNSVKAKLDQLRKTSAEKEQQEKQLSATLSQMERAASESFRRDMISNASVQTLSNESSTSTSTTTADVNLPSKLKRALNQPVQVQCKKAKFIIKTPTPKPVFEPIVVQKDESTEQVQDEPISQTSSVESERPNPNGTWYESKTDNQESFYWNDITGESSWIAPADYLSIDEQRARGLKV
jgi:WW domain-binding protein 4